MRADLGDVELEYEVLGDGPELVWLHGLTGSLEESRPLCELLANRYRVLWYSTRGHGRSTPLLDRAAYSYDKIVADLDRMIDHVGFASPVLAGGSHGANTILRHETTSPGRARGLVLVAPGANALNRPRRLPWALLRASVRRAERKGRDAVVRAITGHDPRDADADPVAVAAAMTHDFDSLSAAMRFVPDQRIVDGELLRSVAVPTVVAAWRRDPLVHPWAVAREVASLIPQAELVEIPRAMTAGAQASADLLCDLVERVRLRSNVTG